jgi:hypothetical protein
MPPVGSSVSLPPQSTERTTKQSQGRLFAAAFMVSHTLRLSDSSAALACLRAAPTLTAADPDVEPLASSASTTSKSQRSSYQQLTSALGKR